MVSFEDEMTVICHRLEKNNEENYWNISFYKHLHTKKMLVVNARFDVNLQGMLTCKGASTVEYFLFVPKNEYKNVRVMKRTNCFYDINTHNVSYWIYY